MFCSERLSLWDYRGWKLGIFVRVVLGLLWFSCFLHRQAAGLRPLREIGRSWGDESVLVRKEDGSELGSLAPWNVTGTYKGTWKFLGSANNSSIIPDFRKPSGDSIIELISTPTRIAGIHYIQGVIIFNDVFENQRTIGGAQIKIEGVYIWPFRQLQLVAYSGRDGDSNQDEEYILSNPYHLLGVFSSQVLQESSHQKIWRRNKLPINFIDKHCNIEFAAQVSRASNKQHDGEHDHYHIEGLVESPSVDDDRECFSPLQLNVTSINTEIYYNKAVNYTLMVTFVSFSYFSDMPACCEDGFFVFLNLRDLGFFPSSYSFD